jgi:hypothetical protein
VSIEAATTSVRKPAAAPLGGSDEGGAHRVYCALCGRVALEIFDSWVDNSMAMSRTLVSLSVAAAIVGAVFYIGAPPSDEGRESAGPVPAPTTDERLRKHQEAEAAVAKRYELERRKQVKAVAFEGVYRRNDEKRGDLLEGTVTNSASFPVYDVQVCLEDTCRSTSPPTLQPGAQGMFSVSLKPDRFSGSARVVWRVEPP